MTNDVQATDRHRAGRAQTPLFHFSDFIFVTSVIFKLPQQHTSTVLYSVFVYAHKDIWNVGYTSPTPEEEERKTDRCLIYSESWRGNKEKNAEGILMMSHLRD